MQQDEVQIPKVSFTTLRHLVLEAIDSASYHVFFFLFEFSLKATSGSNLLSYFAAGVIKLDVLVLGRQTGHPVHGGECRSLLALCESSTPLDLPFAPGCLRPPNPILQQATGYLQSLLTYSERLQNGSQILPHTVLHRASEDMKS